MISYRAEKLEFTLEQWFPAFIAFMIMFDNFFVFKTGSIQFYSV